MKSKLSRARRVILPSQRLAVSRLWGLLLCLAAANGAAQIYSVIHHFQGTAAGNDGSLPWGGLAVSGETLYGTTWNGGSNGWGTVFKLNANGNGYSVLKHFTGSNGGVDDPLAASGPTLYGTSDSAVYKLNTDGSGFTVLRSLSSENPNGPVVLSGPNLYGTTSTGGSSSLGTVFRMSTDGTDFTVLRNFAGGDGANPIGGLVLSENTLYGATWAGGISNSGVIFQINTNGSGFAVMKHFTVRDGANPQAGLLLSGTQLYGTTSSGGAGAAPSLGGTVFKINTDGTGFTVLKDFSAASSAGSDGAYAQGGLALSGTTLYGTTYGGGVVNPERGVLFKLNTDGTGFVVLRCFNGDSFGANPRGNLVLVNGGLYGTTQFGGQYDSGVVFALSLTPPAVAPQSQTAEPGSRVRFAVDAPASWSVNYQWFLNGMVVLSGSSKNSWLELTNVQYLHAGLFTAVITQTGGALTSAPAILNVIAPVERRLVPGLNLLGQAGSSLNVEYTDTLRPANWLPLNIVTLTDPTQWCFDVSTPLPPRRFYRAWQTGTPNSAPSLKLPTMIPALTLTGSVGSQVRVEGINAIGATDAWFALADVTLTNTTQYHFDVSAPGQPQRLYRLVLLP